jgi:hypothetical protein
MLKTMLRRLEMFVSDFLHQFFLCEVDLQKARIKPPLKRFHNEQCVSCPGYDFLLVLKEGSSLTENQSR